MFLLPYSYVLGVDVFSLHVGKSAFTNPKYNNENGDYKTKLEITAIRVNENDRIIDFEFYNNFPNLLLNLL